MLQSLTFAQDKMTLPFVFKCGLLGWFVCRFGLFWFLNLSRRNDTAPAKHRPVGEGERNAVQKLFGGDGGSSGAARGC